MLFVESVEQETVGVSRRDTMEGFIAERGHGSPATETYSPKPKGAFYEMNPEGASEINGTVLRKAFGSPKPVAQVNFRLGGKLLLISESEHFGNHGSRNRRHVQRQQREGDYAEGILGFYWSCPTDSSCSCRKDLSWSRRKELSWSCPQGKRIWRMDVAPNKQLADGQQHVMRMAFANFKIPCEIHFVEHPGATVATAQQHHSAGPPSSPTPAVFPSEKERPQRKQKLDRKLVIKNFAQFCRNHVEDEAARAKLCALFREPKLFYRAVELVRAGRLEDVRADSRKLQEYWPTLGVHARDVMYSVLAEPATFEAFRQVASYPDRFTDAELKKLGTLLRDQ
ncbi:hypothetical protein [Streptomyces sp. WAC06614]|uniref:hypothetical protein n=1 Tax=Streptomyces sp. WAC06614 TaxID=2487416 RepID=UPI000F79DBBF|nr:hypothetical protein [Streptomyces sp. WAC06614]RSS81156.1 hypothetical protein EF918_11215 [Streptomyces sp. WAC06614]